MQFSGCYTCLQQFSNGFLLNFALRAQRTADTISASKKIRTGAAGPEPGDRITRSAVAKEVKAANMHSLIHTLFSASFLFAALITLGVGVLLFCCVGCTRCPGKEEDDLFRHRSA